MELLLRNDFTAHYGLPVATIANISAATNAPYFELQDDNTLIYTVKGQGTAKYSNANAKIITVINYEYFFNSLPPAFIYGKKICDLIVHDYNQQYFLFNELTNTIPAYVVPFINSQGQQSGKRQTAISQLLSTLTLVMNVPTIANFINSHTFRHCCFFNKQSFSPPIINATNAFSRLGTLVSNGLKMKNLDIEALGFEFWEYSGSQVYNL